MFQLFFFNDFKGCYDQKWPKYLNTKTFNIFLMMSLSGYKNSRWSVVFCLGLMGSVRMYHRCTDDYWIRRLMSHLLCLHTLNSEVR